MDSITLDSIDKYNKLYGLKTLHPLVSVVDLTQATRSLNDIRMEYGVYALFLKNSKECAIKYGRRNYDYQEGTVVSFAPGQTAEISTTETVLKPAVYGLLFHPDLIRGTSLGQNIKKYHFFSYSSNESLHLSDAEREIFMDCLHNINNELCHPVDKHSRTLISNIIELLLNYCMRFYERQFITREQSNQDVIQAFERNLDEYLSNNIKGEKRLPSVKYFADKVCLSSNYFGDLIKKETGKSAQEYIHFKLIEKAKDQLSSTNLTVSEIAYELGFLYPQHFSRLFKKHTGISPNTYREKA